MSTKDEFAARLKGEWCEHHNRDVSECYEAYDKGRERWLCVSCMDVAYVNGNPVLKRKPRLRHKRK